MCHNETKWFRALLLATLGAAGLAAQTAPEVTVQKWRQIGNDALDLALAGPATGAVDAVWYGTDGSHLYAHTKSGATYQTVDFENWTPAPGVTGPPVDTAVNVQNLPAPDVRLVAPAASPARVFAIGQHVYRSDDNGASWINLTAYRNVSVIGPGQHSLAVAPGDPDQVVVANDLGVWRSMDGGLSWTGLNQGLPNLAARKILATPNGSSGTRILVDGIGPVEWQPGRPAGWQPLDPATLTKDAETLRTYSGLTGAQVISYGGSGDTIYAGTADGYVFLSIDRGRSFQPTRQSGSFGGPVEGLFVDDAEPRVALAAVAGQGGRVWRTTNSGTFWDDLSQSLPPGAAHAVTADRAAGAVYVATEAGIFYTHADLENPSQPALNWTSLVGRWPNAHGRDVKLDPAGSQLYIALEGYGVFAEPAPHRALAVRLVNAADFSNRPAAPGSLVSVMGARVDSARAGDLNFPVLEASDSESHIQVPFEATGPNVPLALDAAGRQMTIGLAMQPVSPAIFVGRDGEPMIQDADSGLMLDTRNAAHSGARIQIFATGLGKVRPDWPTGMAAPVDQPPAVAASVKAYVDRAPVEVKSATLAGGYVGLYLIELQLPAIVNAGPAELYVSADGQESNRVRIYLEP